MNKQDYEWIRQSRQIIFEQCEQLSDAQLSQQHGFALSTIKDTLIHITKAYRNWMGSYLLGHEIVGDYPAEEVANMTLQDVKEIYALVDRYVFEVIETYEGRMDELLPTASNFKKDESLLKTPHHLLLHVFTHECHHRGQVTAMLHLMGVKPANINMVLFESK